VKIKAAVPAMNQAAAVLASPRCSDATRETPKLPKAVERKADVLLAEVGLGAAVAPVAGAFGTFRTEVDRVPTTDPALIAGRESWREAVVFISQVQPVPADVCGRIRAWVDSGYADAALPVLQPAPVHQLLASAPESDEPDTAAPGLRRAAARMVELGVTTGQAGSGLAAQRPHVARERAGLGAVEPQGEAQRALQLGVGAVRPRDAGMVPVSDGPAAVVTLDLDAQPTA
jgi:hypothetical protein